jgi:hypothetical protein
MGRLKAAYKPGDGEVSPRTPLEVKQAAKRHSVLVPIYLPNWPVAKLAGFISRIRIDG